MQKRGDTDFMDLPNNVVIEGKGALRFPTASVGQALAYLREVRKQNALAGTPGPTQDELED